MNRTYPFRFLLLPAFVLFESSLSLLSPPQDLAVEALFWDRLFGSLAGGTLGMYTIALQDLGFLFLFVILYGDFVARYFGTGAAYYFVRVRSYGGWWLGCTAKLAQICAASSLVCCATFLAVAARTSTQALPRGIWARFAAMAMFLFLLFLFLALFAALLSLAANTALAGVTGGAFLLCGMVLAALFLPHTGPAAYLNPIVLPAGGAKAAAGDFLVMGGQCLALWLLCRRSILRRDITAAPTD